MLLDRCESIEQCDDVRLLQVLYICRERQPRTAAVVDLQQCRLMMFAVAGAFPQ